MTNAEETRRKKARDMRYKKPIVKDLNYFSIRQYLSEIQEECDDVRWFYETDDDTLINALDGDEDEAYEFKMMFSDLSAECEQMLEDLDDWRYSDHIEDLFNLFFVAMDAGDEFGGLLGYDSYEQDYFRIDNFDDDYLEEKSREKIEHMTKKEIVETARRCFRVYQSYISLRYRHDCLKSSLDILHDKNTGHLQVVKEIEKLYDQVDKETSGFRFTWKGQIEKLDKLIESMPVEAFL